MRSTSMQPRRNRLDAPFAQAATATKWWEVDLLASSCGIATTKCGLYSMGNEIHDSLSSTDSYPHRDGRISHELTGHYDTRPCLNPATPETPLEQPQNCSIVWATTTTSTSPFQTGQPRYSPQPRRHDLSTWNPGHGQPGLTGEFHGRS